MHLSTWQKIVLGAGLPVTGILLYLLFRKQSEDVDEIEDKVVTSKQKVLEIKVPHAAVGAIIGRDGANIKQVQEKTKARVKFKDPVKKDSEEDTRTIIIRGTAEAAHEAEQMIQKTLVEISKIFTEEMFVPQKVLGRLIGKNGDNIRHMCRVSSARIDVERSGERRDPDPEARKLVTIKGTADQIEYAKGLIQEVLVAEEDYRKRVQASTESRKSRQTSRIQKHTTPSRPAAEKVEHGALTQDSSNLPEKSLRNATNQKDVVESVGQPTSQKAQQMNYEVTRLVPDPDDYLEAYISAVATPNHFWVQQVGTNSLALDNLIRDMTEHYSYSDFDRDYLANPQCGQLVASMFTYDNMWYRGVVEEVTGDMISVYYIDFGDCHKVTKVHLRPLSPHFRRLPAQAVECKSAYPLAPVIGENWSEETIDAFDDLVYCSKWKVIMLRIISYQDGIPCVDLIDTHGEKDVKIFEQMVSTGLAKWSNESAAREVPVSHKDVLNSGDWNKTFDLVSDASIMDDSKATVADQSLESSTTDLTDTPKSGGAADSDGSPQQASFGDYSLLQSTGIEAEKVEPDTSITEPSIDMGSFGNSSLLSESEHDNDSIKVLGSNASLTDASSFAFESGTRDNSVVELESLPADRNTCESMLSSTKFHPDATQVLKDFDGVDSAMRAHSSNLGDLPSGIEDISVVSRTNGTPAGPSYQAKEFPSGIQDISMIPGNTRTQLVTSLADASMMSNVDKSELDVLEVNQFSSVLDQLSNENPVEE